MDVINKRSVMSKIEIRQNIRRKTSSMSSFKFEEPNIIFILAGAFELHLLVRCHHGPAFISLLVTRAADITTSVVVIVVSVVEPSSL